jgi:hypothetical protein
MYILLFLISSTHIRKMRFSRKQQRQHDIIRMIKMQSSLKSSRFTPTWSCDIYTLNPINYIVSYTTNYFNVQKWLIYKRKSFFCIFFFLKILFFDRSRKFLILHGTIFQSAEMTYEVIYWLLIHAYDKYIIILFQFLSFGFDSILIKVYWLIKYFFMEFI